VSDERVEYNAVLQDYIELFRNQQARQAELLVPQWALERLNELLEAQRSNILGEIDQLAHAYGLLTPTKIIVAVQR
jgi:hypothetical protein